MFHLVDQNLEIRGKKAKNFLEKYISLLSAYNHSVSLSDNAVISESWL